jgi:hypothetical protein
MVSPQRGLRWDVVHVEDRGRSGVMGLLGLLRMRVDSIPIAVRVSG